MEIWKDIKGYEGLYQVSNYGIVKRLESIVKYSNGYNCKHKERFLKFDRSKKNKRGNYYLRVTLSKKNKQKRFSVHQLVAIHFIQNEENKTCVNHKDGNPENNTIKNLEWCTHSENERHSYDILNKVNPNRKLSKEDVKYIISNYVKGQNGNIKELSLKFNVDVRTIYNVINKKYYV
jgi:hypothetical protein